MQSIVLASFAVAAYAATVLGSSTTEPPPTTTGVLTTTPPPETCYTITTTGASCPVPTCPINECLKISTITQSCGCASIYTAYSCTNICTNDCGGTSYNTVYLPCPTSPPFRPTSSSEPSTTSSESSSETPPESSTSSPPEESVTTISSYSNSTMTTSNGGGSGDVTVTSETTATSIPSNTGPKPTTTSLVEANVAGRSVLVEGGLLAGLIAAVLGMV